MELACIVTVLCVNLILSTFSLYDQHIDDYVTDAQHGKDNAHVMMEEEEEK